MTQPSVEKTMMGTYELVRRLGVGGMGEVWLARQRGAAGFSRDVAIKRLLPQAMEQRDVVQMFIEEAQITGRLRHPNVVSVIELGAAPSGELYLVLEYVDGIPLHKLIRDAEARLSVPAALAMARDVALALNAAHALVDDGGNEIGLVHRDVTPSNVMIDRLGHVKLMDFGIAKVRAKTNVTEAGIIKGKIAYLAPEQLRGDIDARSDLFALGLVLWETLAGHQARSGSSDAAMMAKIALDPVAPIRSVVPDLPEAIAKVVDTACAMEPDQRYPNGDAMAKAILDALASLPDAGGIEGARTQLAAQVKLALKREEAQAPTALSSASRMVDGGRAVALTLHSLVVQQDGVTLSRPLTADMIRALPPTGSRRMGTAVTGTGTARGRRPTATVPIVAGLLALAIAGGAVVIGSRGRSGTRPDAHDQHVEPHRDAPPVLAPVPPVLAVVQPTVVADASVAPTVAVVAPQLVRNAATIHGPHRGNSGGEHGASPTGPNVAPDAPATLGISVEPWGNVRIDDGASREAPFRVQLAPGRHTVVISNGELQASRTLRIQLAPGETNIQRIDLGHHE